MPIAPHIAAETRFPGALGSGASGDSVRRLQEWLTFHGFGTPIDGAFGTATERSLAEFQKKSAIATSAQLNPATWEALTRPMLRAIAAPNVTASTTMPELTLDTARRHLAEKPVEIGGDNRGPWVRLYMNGHEGTDWKWCAGFVSFVVQQAASALSLPPPIAGSFSCDRLASRAETSGRLIRGEELASGAVGWPVLSPCAIFLVRRTADDWTHTGFAFEGSNDTFSSIEGNTNDGGSANGFALLRRTRGLQSKDFIRLS